jgi:hypothetical protein
LTGLENNNWVVRAALPALDELCTWKPAELAGPLLGEGDGTVFNGMPIVTDAVSQTMYIGTAGTQIDPDAVINWNRLAVSRWGVLLQCGHAPVRKDRDTGHVRPAKTSSRPRGLRMGSPPPPLPRLPGASRSGFG